MLREIALASDQEDLAYAFQLQKRMDNLVAKVDEILGSLSDNWKHGIFVIAFELLCLPLISVSCQ